MRTSANRGVTLVEVMIAVFIFLIGMAGLLDVTIQCSTMGKRAEYAYTAYNLAKNHLERLKTYDFASLASAAETGTAINADGDPDASGSFTRSTTITTSYSNNANLTMAVVSVSYTMRGVQSATAMQVRYLFYNGG
ncbi:MAG: prepilin-type N-terminal cleavage/methylation domain-containing protein [Candidatus Omnitrophica bacterium]|nr:prepilin-type N-terminal cleavage/methylation domain-containing protein [Candidatus Omnitrophota bacterium]